MQTRRIIVATCLLAAHAALIAGCKSSEPPRVVRDQTEELLSATVEDVRLDERLVTLRGEGGEPVTVVAGPEVRNLEQVKVGDRVVVRYFTGIAAELKRPGEGSDEPTESVDVARADPGERPGAAIGDTFRTIVTIESVDPTFNTVTFRRPDGQVRVVSIEDPQVREFSRRLKAGDRVEVTYTEALAVAVEPQAPVRR